MVPHYGASMALVVHRSRFKGKVPISQSKFNNFVSVVITKSNFYRGGRIFCTEKVRLSGRKRLGLESYTANSALKMP
jgi:hypothetical protein